VTWRGPATDGMQLKRADAFGGPTIGPVDLGFSLILICVRVYYSRLMADEDAVSVREFRANLALYLERANRGETITITRAGRVDCQLGPIEERNSHDGE
jgi:prevent-host-death family protein